MEKNLFNNQTTNGTSLEVQLSDARNNLNIEGIFDGAIIEIEMTYFGISWCKETLDGVNPIQITQPIQLEAFPKPQSTKMRLILTNAGALTNITAGVV